jgi:peptide-methionine (S)-S-oxide reductase
MDLEKATLAAGCFWGVQYYFDQVTGIIKSRVGYIGGKTDNPTYEQVCTHTTGHAEAVELEYAPDLINFDTILKHFFRLHDPTQLNRQGPDIGDQYRSAIFYHNEEQKIIAEITIKQLQENYDKPIVTKLEPASTFFEAEEYHQKYTQRTGHGQCHIPYEPLH